MPLSNAVGVLLLSGGGGKGSTIWIFRAEPSTTPMTEPPVSAGKAPWRMATMAERASASTVISHSRRRWRSTGATTGAVADTPPSAPRVQMPIEGSGASRALARPKAASEDSSATRLSGTRFVTARHAPI